MPGILEFHVGVILHAYSHNRRIGRQAIEEAEGRSIGRAMFIDRGDERDGPWDDGPDQELVSIARGKRRKIEMRVGALPIAFGAHVEAFLRRPTRGTALFLASTDRL